MTKKIKILLGAATLATAATLSIAVVSCGNDEKEVKEQPENNNGSSDTTNKEEQSKVLKITDLGSQEVDFGYLTDIRASNGTEWQVSDDFQLNLTDSSITLTNEIIGENYWKASKTEEGSIDRIKYNYSGSNIANSKNSPVGSLNLVDTNGTSRGMTSVVKPLYAKTKGTTTYASQSNNIDIVKNEDGTFTVKFRIFNYDKKIVSKHVYSVTMK